MGGSISISDNNDYKMICIICDNKIIDYHCAECVVCKKKVHINCQVRQAEKKECVNCRNRLRIYTKLS